MKRAVKNLPEQTNFALSTFEVFEENHFGSFRFFFSTMFQNVLKNFIDSIFSVVCGLETDNDLT